MKRRDRKQDVMAISEQELTVMTNDLDQLHNDVGMPAMHEALEEWTEQVRTSRRRFLIGAGAVAGGAALLATGTSGGLAAASTTASSSSKLTGDLAWAGLAASLESIAVATYGDVLAAATSGKLGSVPPAVAAFVTTAHAQHAQHLQAWNSAIVASGHKAVTTEDPVVAPGVAKALSKVTTVTQAATLALTLEDTAGATYQSAIGALKSTAPIKVAASIEPVERQHAAVLHFMLGQYPVPAAFSPTALARPLSDYTKH